MPDQTPTPWRPDDGLIPVDEYFAAEHFEAVPETDDETEFRE